MEAPSIENLDPRYRSCTNSRVRSQGAEVGDNLVFQGIYLEVSAILGLLYVPWKADTQLGTKAHSSNLNFLGGMCFSRSASRVSGLFIAVNAILPYTDSQPAGSGELCPSYLYHPLRQKIRHYNMSAYACKIRCTAYHSSASRRFEWNSKLVMSACLS